MAAASLTVSRVRDLEPWAGSTACRLGHGIGTVAFLGGIVVGRGQEQLACRLTAEQADQRYQGGWPGAGVMPVTARPQAAAGAPVSFAGLNSFGPSSRGEAWDRDWGKATTLAG